MPLLDIFNRSRVDLPLHFFLKGLKKYLIRQRHKYFASKYTNRILGILIKLYPFSRLRTMKKLDFFIGKN
jgi:hypothetical protein